MSLVSSQSSLPSSLQQLDVSPFSLAYEVAFDEAQIHAAENTDCAHLGCALLLDGKFAGAVQNNRFHHAEMNALSCLKERYECAQGEYV
jgi:hypothetical protein